MGASGFTGNSLSTPMTVLNDRISAERELPKVRDVRPYSLTDIADVGAGIRTWDFMPLPLKFELSFDNFHTIRKCRLIWCVRDFVGAAFAG
jgi:hypothetical protein